MVLVGRNSAEVRQVGKQTYPGQYTLQPAQYSKIKISAWKYTYSEKLRVIRLAREAFDELRLPADADERTELEKKEAEVMNGASSSSEEKVSTPQSLPTPPAAIPTAVTPSKVSQPVSTPRTATSTGSSAAAPAPSKKAPAPKKTGGGLISKQKAKFAAEKRASSMPNGHGTASPRPLDGFDRSRSPVDQKRSKPDKPDKPDKPKEKLGKENGVETNVKRKREDNPAASRSYTSSDTESTAKRKRRPSPQYSSSDSEKPRGRPIARRAPPPQLKLNGHDPAVAPSKQDPEALRDRYEELFPAYQQLAKKLAKVHRACEDGNPEVPSAEVRKMVGKWEKWHAELAEIRNWFGEGER